MADDLPISECAGQTTIDPQVPSGGRHWRRNRAATRILALVHQHSAGQLQTEDGNLQEEDLQELLGIRSWRLVMDALIFLEWELSAVECRRGTYLRGYRAACARCGWRGPARGYERFKAERDATRHAAGMGLDAHTLAENEGIRQIKEAWGR